MILKQKGERPLHLSTVSTDDNIPYLSIEAVEKNESKQYADWYSTIHSTEHDIFVVRTGGRNGLILKAKKGAVGSTLFCLTPLWINSDYLYYFLKLNEFNNSGERDILNTFWNIQVPIVPINNQEEISRKIKETLIIFEKQNKYNEVKLIRSLKSLVNVSSEILESIQNLDDFKKAVLELAMSGTLTGGWRTKHQKYYDSSTPHLPNTWEIRKISEFAECSRGRFMARPRNNPIFFKNGKFPFIQINDIPNNGGFITSHKQVLNDEGILVSKSFPLNTVVLAIVGSTIGNTGILSYETYFPDSIVGMNTNNFTSNRYLEFFLRNKKNSLREISYSSGGQPNLRLEILKELTIPIPPLDEQTEIVFLIDNIFQSAERINADSENEKLKQIELEKAILSSFYKEFAHYEKPEKALLEIESARNKKELEVINLKKKQKLYRNTLFKFGDMRKYEKDLVKKVIKEIILKEYLQAEILTHKEIDEIHEKTKQKSGDFDYDNFSTVFIEMSQDALNDEEEPFFMSVIHEGKLAYKIKKHETSLS